MKKLKNSRGETILEILAAAVILLLVTGFFLTSVLRSKEINEAAGKQYQKNREAIASAECGPWEVESHIRVRGQEIRVYLNRAGEDGVVSYRLKP